VLGIGADCSTSGAEFSLAHKSPFLTIYCVSATMVSLTNDVATTLTVLILATGIVVVKSFSTENYKTDSESETERSKRNVNIRNKVGRTIKTLRHE
jgi:hypothetical protein